MTMTLPIPTENAVVTAYDRANFATYTSLLDAVAAGVEWRKATAVLYGIDAAVDEQAARQVFDANLARARWMTTVGYRLLAGLPPRE